MAERPRVLLAIPELGSGGPDRVFFELLCALGSTDLHPLLLVTKAGGRYFDALPADVEVCVIGGGRYPVWRFARAVDKLRPDIVLTTLRMNSTAAFARFFQRHRPPLVIRQANAMRTNFEELRRKAPLKYGFAQWVLKQSLRLPDAMVAQSEDMAAELIRDAPTGQRIAVIGNPVSIDEIKTSCAAQVVKLEGKKFGNPALVAVGRLVPQKGFDLLLEAFAEIRREHKDAALTILGEGPDRPRLEADIERLRITESVRLPGHSDFVLAELALADIFVSSSRYEGFSNAILEAMALSKAVVATACEGGTRDMVIDGKTGVLAGTVSAHALAMALRRALGMDLRLLGEAGCAHVAARFSRRGILAKYGAFLRQVIDDTTDVAGTKRKSQRQTGS